MRNYSLRFSLLPSADFEQKVGFLLDFCEKARIDDVMFFISPEEVNDGHITIEQAKKYTDVILRAKKLLTERGITVSLNPWCTLSHYDGGRKLKPGQNFRTMVGADGTTAQHVVCPLCENWRQYYAELMEFFVATLEPKIIWFEDDLRYSNHDPIWLGCFCEEHMRLFNAALNADYDRETFLKKVVSDLHVRETYLDIISNVIRELVEYVVKRIPQDVTFGLMTGGTGQAEGIDYAATFSAMKDGDKHGKPYNRICLHSYRQRGLQAYAWAFNESSMLCRKFTGDFAYCVSEMENYPHSLYTKSAHYLKYQLLTTAPLGLFGDTFSIFEFNGNGAVNYEKYAAVLNEIKPYLSRIGELDLRPQDMVGVQVLVNEKSSYTIKCKKGELCEIGPKDGWLFAYLTQLGIACAYTTDIEQKGKIFAVSGQVLRNYDVSQIEKLFADNFVIITADNVEALKDMGLLRLIGAEDFEIYKELCGKYTMEELNTEDEIFGVKKLRATAQFFCGDYYNIRYGNVPKKVWTNMLNYDESVVGAGFCEVGNTLVIPYANVHTDQHLPISLLCPLREFVIKESLRNNKVNVSDLFFIDEENVCIYAFDKGDEVYMVIVNFVDDDYNWLHFDAPYLFDNIKYFDADNAEPRQAYFICENGRYTLKHTLKAQESMVLIGYKYKRQGKGNER